ncbi:bifunctional glutamate N-acetyltransferase/amino-acid acetyltransferase ArgJ [uncultured Allofournierella sp.]|uniref:bifunctional glutamate N-acetyltransferase/amino-acid acetyltransferase ArgJ n=1 Tax=uncultured Allofournierella sp. TaxID=1940258 RepID=UPI0025FD2579|nr:bifunctional glutamate N-acetyltransferase/amino-acid acetyltransferase ArgJ [uncultured Fournierella sp.]
MKQIEGGVCAAAGFKAAGVHCGIRKNQSKRDLGLIVSDCKASAAAVYTTNLVKGAPLLVTKEHLADGTAQAILCNSGNANTCNADGPQIANAMCQLAADQLGLAPEDVAIASTGVIGQPLNLEVIQAGMAPLVEDLAYHNSLHAATAIMTTDTIPKEAAVEFELDGKVCHLGGIAKGSGMIHPNMATMLVFLTTDAAISSELLQKALSTFNMVSVDGDISTNDMVVILVNGMAGNAPITQEDKDFAVFMKALNTVTMQLCKMLAGDGEGATHLLECKVSGAADLATARTVAKSVICSSLVKAAIFGADANWGRILCAIGYSGTDVNVQAVDVAFVSKAGRIEVCKAGAGIPLSEERSKQILLEHEIEVQVELNSGSAESTAWGCDLTYDYVKINGDYRT